MYLTYHCVEVQSVCFVLVCIWEEMGWDLDFFIFMLWICQLVPTEDLKHLLISGNHTPLMWANFLPTVVSLALCSHSWLHFRNCSLNKTFFLLYFILMYYGVTLFMALSFPFCLNRSGLLMFISYFMLLVGRLLLYVPFFFRLIRLELILLIQTVFDREPRTRKRSSTLGLSLFWWWVLKITHR